MTGMVSDMKPNEKILLEAANQGFSTATDLADWLVKELKIPFRKSHEITGKIVELADRSGCNLIDLDLASLKSIEDRITEKIFSVLTVDASVTSRNSYGGTSPAQVEAQVKLWKKRLL